MSNLFQKTVSYFSITVIVIGSIFLANGLILAWEPPGSSPPANNVQAPLNISSDPQFKSGALGLGGILVGYSGLKISGSGGTVGDGVVSCYTDETIIYGYGTLFTSQVKINDVITIDGTLQSSTHYGIVTSISDDSQLIIDTPCPTNILNKTYGIYQPISRFTDTYGTDKFRIAADGQLCIGTDCISAWNETLQVFWQPGSGSDIYYEAGQVGIGTTDPKGTLDVYGDLYGLNEYSFSGADDASDSWDCSGMTNCPKKSSSSDDSWYVYSDGGGWDKGIMSRRSFRRTPGLTLEYEAYLAEGGFPLAAYYMVGFIDGNSTSYNYGQSPSNMIYQRGSSPWLQVYENGSNRGSDYAFDTRDNWYRFKTVLKGQGADYYVYKDNVWHLIKSTSGNSDKYVKVLISANQGYLYLRGMRVYQENQQHLFDSIVASRLEVSADNDELMRLSRTGAVNPTNFKMGTDGSLVINNNNSDVLAIKSGQVGIGTTTINYTLDVDGIINASNGIRINGLDISDTRCDVSETCSQLCIGDDCRPSWPSGGAGLWTQSGSDIYYDAGNVGIGQANPSAELTVHGNVTLTKPSDEEYSPGHELSLQSWTTSVSAIHAGWIQGSATDTCNGDITNVYTCPAGSEGTSCVDVAELGGGGIYFYSDVDCVAGTDIYSLRTDGGTLQFLNTARQAKMVIGQDGNVGIGTAAPAYELDVLGTINASTDIKVNGVSVTTDNYNPDNPPTATGRGEPTRAEIESWGDANDNYNPDNQPTASGRGEPTRAEIESWGDKYDDNTWRPRGVAVYKVVERCPGFVSGTLTTEARCQDEWGSWKNNTHVGYLVP